MRKHSLKKFNSSGLNSHSNLQTHQKLSTLPDTTDPLSTTPFSKWRSNHTEKTFSFAIDSHITIFAKVELSRKRVSLLLEQEILRVCSEGFSLIDYFSFEWMLNYLIGSGNVQETQGNKMSIVVYSAHLILLSYRQNWNLLYKKTPLHLELQSLLTEIFGKLSDRKYQGRNSLYQIDKFLLIKIEDMESFMERSHNSVRFSSYCKGYGESGRSVRKQSTRYNDELDRDDSEKEPEEVFSFWKSSHYLEDLFTIEQIIREEKKT